MGILTRPLMRPQQRWDLEDFNTGLSALRADSHFYTKRLISDKAYIFQGFTISNTFIGQPTADINLTNATLINGNNTGDVSWWTAPESPTPITLPTGVDGLQGGRNYIEIEVNPLDGTPLQRAFWDPSANSGAGVEFTQEVNTVTEMFVNVSVNQTGFTVGNPNMIPVAIIDLDVGLNIKGIRDKRNMMFRLGKPDDIDAQFTWGTREEPTTILVFPVPSGTAYLAGETVTFTSGATATVVTGGTNNIEVFDFSTDSVTPGDIVSGGTSGASAALQSYYENFTGADKDIRNYRDAFTALMNEIRVVKGTRFWYEIGNVVSLPSLLNYVNSLVVPVSSGARFAWTGSAFKITDNQTSGQTTVDPIAAIRIPGYGGDLILTRQDGSGGSASLSIPDGSLLYVQLPASGTSRTWSQSGPLSTNFKVVDREDFIPSDSNFILAYREGSKIIFPSGGELSPGEDQDIGEGISKETLAFIGAESETSTNPQYTTLPSVNLSNQFTTSDSLTQSTSVNAANINDMAAAILKPYEEKLTVVSGAPASSNEVTGPLSIAATITIPLDSRNASVQKKYVVGQGGLILFLNGQHLVLNEDYTEIGSTGSLSSTIQLLQGFVVGDELDIRIINPQFFGTVGADQAFFVNYLTGQNGSSMPVGSIYNTGTDRLQVWRNGLAMLRTSSVGDVIERYLETNANSIALSQAANPDEVFVMVNHEAPNPNVTLITGVTGTVLTVPTYVIGNKALRVFRNGVMLTLNVAATADIKYGETSTTTITLALAAAVTDVFKIFRAGTPPQWRESINGVTGFVITVPNSRTFTHGDPKLLVFRNGLMMYNSTVLGNVGDRYQQTGTTQVTLSEAAVTSDLFEFIYV